MLKENSFKENDMIAMRLNGGEEIIGKFVKQDEQTITLARPLALAMTQNGIAMTPHLIMAEPTCSLPYNKSLIITESHVDPDFGAQTKSKCFLTLLLNVLL